MFAEKLGYFDELNIEIVLVPFTNGPAMIEANADWDIATCGEGGMCNAMVGYGMRVIDINDYEENLALFVRPGSPLAQDPNNPDNWKGTEWVYPAGTTAQAVLVSALKKVGLTLDDITSINMDVSKFKEEIRDVDSINLELGNIEIFEKYLDGKLVKARLTWKILNTDEIRETHNKLLKIDGYDFFSSLEGENFHPHISLGSIDPTKIENMNRVKEYIEKNKVENKKYLVKDIELNLCGDTIPLLN